MAPQPCETRVGGNDDQVNRALPGRGFCRDALAQYDILRIRDYLPLLYVSEHFVRAFESNSFTGYSFCEVELR